MVARARCFASGGRLALTPVTEWLRTPALRSRVEQLDPAWRVEVGRLVPELGPGGEQERSLPLADAWRRRQFFEGLTRAVLAADQPTLLVLDDLQWCDSETLAWLELLVHFDPNAPLLVVATLRSEELDDNPEVVAWRRRLRATGTLRELELGPLTVEEAGELAATLGGHWLDEDAMRQLAADTGGFPLFVVESLREGSTRPSRTDAVLAGRLAQLSAPAEELAGLAAAVGRDVSLELLAVAGAVDDDRLVGAVDELWRRRLLREHSAATYDFSHDLLRAAAYERLTPPHRRLLHRRVAGALEQLHADDLDGVAAQIADQHERGGQPDRAIRFHVMAAGAATAVLPMTMLSTTTSRPLGCSPSCPPERPATGESSSCGKPWSVHSSRCGATGRQASAPCSTGWLSSASGSAPRRARYAAKRRGRRTWPSRDASARTWR